MMDQQIKSYINRSKDGSTDQLLDQWINFEINRSKDQKLDQQIKADQLLDPQIRR